MYFTVIHEWAYDGETGGAVVAIEETEENAKKAFSQKLVEEKQFAEENDWCVYVDEEDSFDAGREGFYNDAHTCLFIQRVG